MDELQQRDLAVLWHPCSQMNDYQDFPPIEVVGAQGCHLTLGDGRQVIDAISSWWCKSLGHRHPHVEAGLIDQARRFDQVILANTTNEPVVRLCERLLAAANGHPPSSWGSQAPAGRLPGWFGKVFLADNGSTGVEIALKMALQAQRQSGQAQRTRFAALAGGYHGETVATLSVGDCGLYGLPYEPLFFDVPKLGPLPLRQGSDDPAWEDAADCWPAIAAQLDAVADELAAIVYEPILQGAGGMRLYSPDLLRRLRAWADDHGVYLIADEIAAGMGRCGAVLASHLAGPADRPYHDHGGCLPDMAVLSKGLSAGVMPLSAVLCPDAIYDCFLGAYSSGRAFLHSNTYTGNALAVAVANAALDVYADEDVCGQARSTGAHMLAGLRALAEQRSFLTNVRGVGMMAAVDIRAADGGPLDPSRRTGLQVFRRAIARGAWFRPLGDTMYCFPPLIMSPALVDEMLAILAASLDDVLG